MLITQKLGNLQSFQVNNRSIDLLPLEWYETSKRIMTKRTNGGQELTTKFLQADPQLGEGDVLFQNEHYIIALEILPCDVIVTKPVSRYQVACICYEIGNKHLPLFVDGDDLLVPFDGPLFRLFNAGGYAPLRDKRKLLHPIKTTVSPHSHNGSKSLFTRIMKLTNPAAND